MSFPSSAEVYDSTTVFYNIFTVGKNSAIYESSSITYLASKIYQDSPTIIFNTEPITLYAWSKNPYSISVGVSSQGIKITSVV